MKLNEFKFFWDFQKETKEEKESSIKGKEFSSLVPVVLQPYASLIRVRDMLDVDGTFAIVSSNVSKFTLVEALNLYESTRDIIIDTTYTKVLREGFIKDLDGYEGFWIQVG